MPLFLVQFEIVSFRFSSTFATAVQAASFSLVPKVGAALWERSSERDSVSPPAHDDLKRSPILTRPPPKRSFASHVRSKALR